MTVTSIAGACDQPSLQTQADAALARRAPAGILVFGCMVPLLLLSCDFFRIHRNAMLTALAQAEGRVNIFNLGTDEYCQVDDSVGWISQRLAATPERSYSGGERGWVGDNPFIFLETERIRSLGWVPKLSIREGVERTVDWLRANPWVFPQKSL